ncbi:hypothetical protein GFS03_03740 [Sulfolobus sp. E5-1-F]|uniref:hypothetical protein n=1 Tax=Sulfolobaceae TaxID=118883 RepID=UPI001297BC27|nr:MULTISPECIES: hypothetical protein [unclassified Sulfolobus]QGA53762.1 hypothetical protein GFS03_03740 [Sulfolobus sp. E5-1-F]QGA68584.1 hypothetical protein GFS33_07495 [Sulfolobus sp. E11-6]
MKFGLLTIIGFSLLVLSLLSINSPIYSYVSISNLYTITIPKIAYATVRLLENNSNVTVYVKLFHDGQVENIVKLPYFLELTPGTWEFSIYNETFPITLTKVINATVVNKSDGIVYVYEYQKIEKYQEIVTTKNGTYPITLEITIYKVNIFQYKTVAEILSVILIFIDIVLWGFNMRDNHKYR